MSTWIDWHSHHTAPEVAQRIAQFTGREPHIDKFDSPDFSRRIKEMNEVGLDIQLICQGAGVYADQLPADQALEVVRESNRALAERIPLTAIGFLELPRCRSRTSMHRLLSWSGPRGLVFAPRCYIRPSMARWS